MDGLQGNDVFDPTLDLTEEAQQRRAVVKIQKLLINSNVSEAVKLLRTARWVKYRTRRVKQSVIFLGKVLCKTPLCCSDSSCVSSPKRNLIIKK